jgi:cytochrome c oxidase cbb3-type subunit I/II
MLNNNGQPGQNEKLKAGPDVRPDNWHRRMLEGRVVLFSVVTTVVISIGGIAEIVPMFSVKAGPQPLEGVTPYSPLELAGRDIYIREGCYTCHSQMVRPMRAELQRYGEWTRAGELAYDRPFLLGSRRIGPDLQRVGGKYPDAWHYEHMRDPRSTSPGSVMPRYPWLLTRALDARDVTRSVVAMQKLGVPYMGVNEETVTASLAAQGGIIARSLASMNIQTEADREIIAVIAYLQRLGLDGKAALERASNAAAAGPADDPHTGLNTKAPVNPHGGANDPAASAPVNPHGPSGAQDVKPANPHGGNR